MNLQDGTPQLGWSRHPRLALESARADVRQRGHSVHTTNFGDLLRRIRRNQLHLGLWVALWVALASGQLAHTTPKFDAKSQIVLQARVPFVMGAGAEQSINNVGSTLDSAQADSQVNVIKSERVLRYVFDTLKLGQAPGFVPPPPGVVETLVARVLHLVPALQKPPLRSEEQRAANEARAFQIFSDGLTVKRVGQSYAIEVTYRAPDPDQAAHLANAVTASYIRDLVLYRAATIQQSVAYLQNRTTTIQEELDTAASAVKSGFIPDFQFADSDARVTGAARVPQSKAYPVVSLTLVLAVATGLVTGLGFILVRYKLDRTVHSRQQIAQTLDIDIVNLLPRYADSKPLRVARNLPATAVSEVGGIDFLEGLRGLRTTLLSAEPSLQHIVVGVVSWNPGEGRSTIASNLARIVAASRERVMLLDGDLRNPALTRALAPEAAMGLDEALMSHCSLTAPLAVELSSTLSFIPAVAGEKDSDPDVFLGVPEMGALMKHLRADRDVIIDLPPISLSSDAQAVGHLLDGVILVVEAERTTVDDINDACRALDVASIRLLTVALNKTAPLARKRAWRRSMPSRT